MHTTCVSNDSTGLKLNVSTLCYSAIGDISWKSGSDQGQSKAHDTIPGSRANSLCPLHLIKSRKRAHPARIIPLVKSHLHKCCFRKCLSPTGHVLHALRHALASKKHSPPCLLYNRSLCNTYLRGGDDTRALHGMISD